MGFAVDLGRLYMARAELKAAANSMALSAARELIGTDLSIENATAAGRRTLDSTSGNRYDYGGVRIGETTGSLASEAQTPTYWENAADATAEQEGAGGTEAGGPTARHARITITGETPLIFWSFLSLGQERKVNLITRSVAGRSAPLCTACQIESIAVASLDATDTTHYGFTPNTKYTFGYQCTGIGQPGLLAGTVQRISYLLLNRLNDDATLFADPSSQLYRIGAQGLPGSTVTARSCFQLGAEESLWTNASPNPCVQNVSSLVSAFVCGLASRFDVVPPASCAQVPEIDSMAQAYQADTELADIEDYAAYTGTTRRVITVPVVETLSTTGTMTVLAFRQFLVEPVQNNTVINTADSNGRFGALYIGSVAPVRQGSFAGCAQPVAGPGKVVLHQ